MERMQFPTWGEHRPSAMATPGEPTSKKNAILTNTASVTQDFEPMRNIGAHLHAFHAYADDTKRYVEANHYCGHLSNDVRQCLIYDSTGRDARLIGIEYMIAPHLYESLPQEERRLWHSHVYEVKSGMLVMPNRTVPATVWDAAERKEMAEIITLYGKTYHLWQTDRGDKLPLGEPKLMTSLTADGQLDAITMKQRDEKFGISCKDKKASRADIRSPKIHPDADSAWSRKR
ncbi:hypothetical protein E4U52_008220 [Claviceps spartinae]|nr:hypothetical protein E4U52_008220 [Claviceps spartinae]KAG6110718.1 hypothetical protein E4U31_005420 [Claviceps sp. LM219 group G6]